MPTNVLYTDTSSSLSSSYGSNNLTAFGGAANLNDAVNVGISVSHNDTKQARGELSQDAACHIVNCPTEAATITLFQVGGRADASEAVGSINHHVVVGTSLSGSVNTWAGGTSLSTKGPTTLANNPSTTSAWVAGDINGKNNSDDLVAYVIHTGNQTVNFHDTSSIWMEVTWEAGGGGFALWVTSVLPPFISLIGGGLNFRELERMFCLGEFRLFSKKLDGFYLPANPLAMRPHGVPSTRKDFLEALDFFRRRPVFAC